jgi:hypothetical protein
MDEARGELAGNDGPAPVPPISQSNTPIGSHTAAISVESSALPGIPTTVQEHPKPMLEVHAPHNAVHTWKSFFIHIAIIVIGLLIAVGLEQTVEWIHWRERVAQARESIHEETAKNGRYYVLRQATQECISKRLGVLRSVVDAVAAHRPVEPIGHTNPEVGRPLADAIWESERASQTLTHFPRDELAKLSTVYAALVSLRRWEGQELNAYSNIAIMEGDPGRLGAEDLALLRQDIEMAETMNAYTTTVAARQLKEFEALGIRMPIADSAVVAEICQPIERSANTSRGGAR